MAETVQVPALGQVKRTHLYVGGALVVGIVGYAWWSRGTAAPTDVPAYTEEDVTDAVSDTPGGAPGAGANDGADGSEGGWQAPRTDAEWTQQATDGLEGSYERQAISDALGRYITRQTLPALDERIVRAAIAAYGYPPGGRYPILTGTGSTPSALTEPTGLTVRSTAATSVNLAWNTVPGASGYWVYRSGSDAPADKGGDGVATVYGLTPGTTYTFTVRAVDSSGRTGPPSAPVTARTTAAPAKPGAPAPAKPGGVPRHRTRRITRRGQTVADLVAAYNREHGTRHTWQDIWAFNERWRPSVRGRRSGSTVRVYVGSTVWFPY